MSDKQIKHYFGSQLWIPPYHTNGRWVEDATGKSVAEAATNAVAEGLVLYLNNGARVQAKIKAQVG